MTISSFNHYWRRWLKPDKYLFTGIIGVEFPEAGDSAVGFEAR